VEPNSQVVTKMTETEPTREADFETTSSRAQSASVKQMPLISVIMPVRNERKTLPALLDSLVNQDYPKDLFEILVADGRSDDGTREFVAEYGLASPVLVRFVDNPAIRSGPGRNAGISQARGEFIVFVDGHCHIPSSSLLLDTVRLFDESRADCLCRPQPLSAPTSKSMGRVIANVRASSLGHGRDSLIYDMEYSGFVDPASSGASYRRLVFEAIGRYDESFDACEDVEFNTRLREAGMTAYTDPALAVYYEPRSSLKALFLQMSRYGKGRVRLARKHPGGISISQFAPMILLLWLALSAISIPIFLLYPTWPLAIGYLPALLYLIVIVVGSVKLAGRYGLAYLLLAPGVYLAIHLGLGRGMLSEAFRGLAGFKSQTSADWQKD
jgi:succinoglycan biosynthesis protein ExoA